MTSQQILHADVLDILFEKRNKLYGAYQLRKMYSKQLTIAVAIAVSSAFLLLYLFHPAATADAMKKEEGKVVIVEQFMLPKEEKKIEPPKAPEPPKTLPVKQQLFSTQITITEKDIITPVPPQDVFETAAVSNVTTNGKDATTFQPPVGIEAKEVGNSSKEPEAEKEVVPDKQPQFPGGMKAWIAFLSQHLRSPQDLEPGEKRTVLIRFHVAEDGSITNFQVLQSAGSTFDNEVIRVLKKMPVWSPATKAGQPVPVSFTQPVTFVGMEE